MTTAKNIQVGSYMQSGLASFFHGGEKVFYFENLQNKVQIG